MTNTVVANEEIKVKPQSTFTLLPADQVSEPFDSSCLRQFKDFRGKALPVMVTLSKISDELYYMGCNICKKKMSEVCLLYLIS